MHALVFDLGADRYAVDTTHTREVVARPPVTTLPTAPRAVLGVFNLRGEIVPLFHTAALLGVPGGDDHDVAFAIVVDTPLGLAGLAATGVREAVDLGEPVGEADAPGTVAVHDVARQVVVRLDLDALLAADRVAS